MQVQNTFHCTAQDQPGVHCSIPVVDTASSLVTVLYLEPQEHTSGWCHMVLTVFILPHLVPLEGDGSISSSLSLCFLSPICHDHQNHSPHHHQTLPPLLSLLGSCRIGCCNGEEHCGSGLVSKGDESALYLCNILFPLALSCPCHHGPCGYL